MPQLDVNTDQIIVTVATDKRPTAVARAVSTGISAGIAHQASISLGEQRRGEDTCWGQSDS